MSLFYRRVLLKLSGEVLVGASRVGIDPQVLGEVADELARANEMGAELALVIGGGNIFRGLSEEAREMDRVLADYMGMLATVINGLALEDALKRRGAAAKTMSAIAMAPVAEPYDVRKAKSYLDEGTVVILTAGTGNPYFTTDTAAVLRAAELGAELLVKGTKVGGVYDKDPEKHPDARKYDRVSYLTVVKDELRVMDLAAVALARDNGLKIQVFDMTTRGNIIKVLSGEKLGTLVSGERDEG